MTVEEYVTRWYKLYRAPRNQRSTNALAEINIRVHIRSSALGKMELDCVTPRDVQIFLMDALLHGNQRKIRNSDRRGKPLSRWTVRKLRQMLISAFRQAVRDGIVLRNPAEETDPIPVQNSCIAVFSRLEQKEFLERTQGSRFHTAYLLFFYTGCRRSEILGLCWQDIDFENRFFRVRRTLVMVAGKPYLRDGTKTQKSVRTIPLPEGLKNALSDVRKQFEIESMEEGYSNPYHLVFTNRDGSPLDPRCVSRNFRYVAESLGLYGKHLHCTRHTWATNMLQCGTAIPDVQALGGWSSPSTLLSIYAHTVQDSQKNAMDTLWQRFHEQKSD